MIYSNLLYLLVVILVLSTGVVPEEPGFLPAQAFGFFFLKLSCFYLAFRIYLAKKSIRLAKDYMGAETWFSIIALGLFVLDIYLFDVKYYLSLIPFSSDVPSLVSIFGLFLFLFYLSLLWLWLRKSYEQVFDVRYRPWAFVSTKFKLCISLVLPWIIMSFLYDLVILVPWGPFKSFIDSPWGESVLFVVFIAAAVICFPTILIRLWGCTPVTAGPVRDHVENFCREQGVSFKEICYWPLFEGKVLTAGVLGMVRNFRYLMITPALQEALTEEELESVIAHEIGHVKKKHLPLYLLLFLGFGVVGQLSVQPIMYLLFGSEFFYEIFADYQGEPGTLLATVTGVPLIILTLLYFRYVFGYFMRNFERQADLHAYKVMGDAAPLIRVFEKIAWFSGKVRDLPSWHHFGIGQRVEYLLECQRGERKPFNHDLKVYGSLVAYLSIVIVSVMFTLQISEMMIDNQPGRKFAEAVIMKRLETEPNNPIWHQFLGDLKLGRKKYDDAIAAYEQSLELEPENPEVLNNLAWLLLTIEKKEYQDPGRALKLAQRAVNIQARGYILDTLAEAYWQNGLSAEAIETMRLAIDKDPRNRDYYRKQLQKFNGT